MASGAEEDPEQGGSAAMATNSQLQQAGQLEAEADNLCPICLSTIDNVAYIDGCFHTFCFGCIQQWAARRAMCLLCRQPFNRILHTVRADDDYEEYEVASSTHSQRTTARPQVRGRSVQHSYNLRPRPTTQQPARGRRGFARSHRGARGGPAPGSRGGPAPGSRNASARQAAGEHPATQRDPTSTTTRWR